MLSGRWNGAALGRVNPYVPLAVIAAGAILFLTVSRPIGLGVAVGAILAFVNALFLSGRVEIAADTGDVAGALLVMQAGLMTTFILVGIATIILVKLSVAAAVASAAGFVVAQFALLAVFYWTRGRADIAAGRQSS